MININSSEDRYPLSIDGAEHKIKLLCEEKAAQLYGDNLPDIVQNRLNDELESILHSGYATLFLVAYEIANRSKMMGFPVRADRTLGSSFVAFLLGIADTNPLPCHRYCAECGCFEIARIPEQYGAVAFDLAEKPCPRCGSRMKKDGANIPFEMLVGAGKNREPDIAICVASSIHQLIYQKLQHLFGEDHIIRGSIITKSEDGTADVKVDPSAIHLLPDTISVDDITSLVEIEDEEGTVVKVSDKHDRWELSFAFTTIDVISDKTLDSLHTLERSTGCLIESIPADDSDTLQLFIDADTDGIPFFEDEKAKHLLSRIRQTSPNSLSFSTLTKVLALSDGIGIWDDYEVREESIANGRPDDVICFRDEVYLFLLDKGMDVYDAESITTSVRKGKIKRFTGLNKEMVDLFSSNNIDGEYINKLEAIEYVQAKAQCVSMMQVCWRLAFYKAHYPKQFEEALHSYNIKVQGDAVTEVSWIEKSALVPNRLIEAQRYNEVGRKAEKLYAGIPTLCTGCIRLSKLFCELNSELEKNNSDAKTLDIDILNRCYFFLLNKSINAAKDLSNTINGAYRPNVFESELGEEWSPALYPVDLNNDLSGDYRVNTKASDPNYLEGLTLFNKLILVWNNLTLLFDQGLELALIAVYFVDMENFKDQLQDINRINRNSYLQLRMEMEILQPLQGFMRGMEELMVDFVDIYNSVYSKDNEISY